MKYSASTYFTDLLCSACLHGRSNTPSLISTFLTPSISFGPQKNKMVNILKDFLVKLLFEV